MKGTVLLMLTYTIGAAAVAAVLLAPAWFHR